MKLQILVNHYQEPTVILDRLLNSIDEQCFTNEHSVEVLVCTDGIDEAIKKERFERFRVPIIYFNKEHSGVCATRNTLLDLSNAEYVMFCDCDDQFSKPDGIQKLLNTATSTKADIIGSTYEAELTSESGFRYVKINRDEIRVHGKIFKREYLLKESIRFPDEMTFSGDMYFLWLAFHLTRSIVWLPDSFYIWKWYEKSVTRSRDWYSVQTYDKMLQCYTLVIRELKRRGLQELYQNLIAVSISHSYIDWHSDKFKEAPEQYVINAKAAIVASVNEFVDVYRELPEAQRRKVFISSLIHRRFYHPSTKFNRLLPWANYIQNCSTPQPYQNGWGVLLLTGDY